VQQTQRRSLGRFEKCVARAVHEPIDTNRR